MSSTSGRTSPAPVARCLAVWLGVGAAAAALGALVVPDLVTAVDALTDGSWRTRSFEELLVWLASGAAATALAWLWVVAGLVSLDAARGVRARVPGCPGWLRRALLAACGAAVTGTLVAGMAVPASADPLPRPVPADGGSLASNGSVTAPASDGPDLDGLPLPDRPRSDAGPGARVPHARDRPPEPRRAPRADHPAGDELHVVRPGDTLWGLAATQLADGRGREPSDAEVDARWRAIWAANADVVGPDPDLILPGQRLRSPGAETSPTDPSQPTRPTHPRDRSGDQEEP
jgi:resuscitation-promoting factor RpfA